MNISFTQPYDVPSGKIAFTGARVITMRGDEVIQNADIVVTEYGIARLLNRSQRERANELIAVAHPDFRAELRKAAQKLFWP